MTNYSDYYEIKELTPDTLCSMIDYCVKNSYKNCAVVCMDVDDLPKQDSISDLCAAFGNNARAHRNPFDYSIRVGLPNRSEVYFLTYNDLTFYKMSFEEILVYNKHKFSPKQLQHLELRLNNFEQDDESSELDKFLNSFTTRKM